MNSDIHDWTKNEDVLRIAFKNGVKDRRKDFSLSENAYKYGDTALFERLARAWEDGWRKENRSINKVLENNEQ